MENYVNRKYNIFAYGFPKYLDVTYLTNSLGDRELSLSIIYSYTGCLIKKLNGELCPNPCKRNPCNFIYQSMGNVCRIINGGFYNYDYTCDCKFGYKWNSQSEECSRIDVCKDQNSCIKNNSISCQVIKPEEGNFKCICQPQFMGLQCKLPRDPCIWPNANQIVGAEKCGYNGKCIGSIGTDSYYCMCHSGYTDNPSNSYSDCQVYEALCEGILCVNGVCVASTKNAICVCNEGYSDSQCATKLPYWLNWETWGDCYPRCGTNRKQNRTRSCSEKGNYCVGTRYEWKTCNDTICLVNGIFENWNDWLPCDHNCGTGEQVSTRSCIYNTDLGEEGWGKPCPVKKSTRKRYCNVHTCVNSIRQRLFELAAETIRRFEGKLNVKSTGIVYLGRARYVGGHGMIGVTVMLNVVLETNTKCEVVDMGLINALEHILNLRDALWNVFHKDWRVEMLRNSVIIDCCILII
ncbi:hypothetical protein A3Q56_04261 [Intoshia linei]|uniref:EGF-like domain-containing protein n=1 Tax=Intoshia linei TaxID=1819745 RepID=A0A177B139_9BILA|nr:hypothetical protein A3Q56_04261 [Intoshia linei]